MNSDLMKTFNLLGLKIAALNMASAVGLIADWLTDDQSGRYICVSGVHGIMESLEDCGVKDAHNHANLCLPDGMPLTWIGRCRGHREMNRVYGPDLMLAVLELSAEKGYTNYFYGGKEGIAEELKQAMITRFPRLQVIGTHCPPFHDLTSEETDRMAEEINSLRPDLLWVGLSTPKQELFMAAHASLLQAKIMIGVGAAFDFHTGRIKQAPSWMQRCGLEWLFRLCVEPRRLWRRYLRNNPLFLFHLFLECTRLRKYPVDQERAPQA
jgi:N-acetylglucosaminyldiphosphoundecaprenol N-acetyl-beta-D-mannosaminyltransferase